MMLKAPKSVLSRPISMNKAKTTLRTNINSSYPLSGLNLPDISWREEMAISPHLPSLNLEMASR